MLTGDPEKLEGHRTYIDGKMRRYNLLFAVNGGVFAVAKLMADPSTNRILGALTLEQLAAGGTIFIVLMWLDIWAFGYMMRTRFFGGQDVFGMLGRVVLTTICALLLVGWLLVAKDRSIVGLTAIGCVAAVMECVRMTRKMRTA